MIADLTLIRVDFFHFARIPSLLTESVTIFDAPNKHFARFITTPKRNWLQCLSLWSEAIKTSSMYGKKSSTLVTLSLSLRNVCAALRRTNKPNGMIVAIFSAGKFIKSSNRIDFWKIYLPRSCCAKTTVWPSGWRSGLVRMSVW